MIEVPVLAGQTVALCTAGVAAAEGSAGGLGDDAGPELLAGSFAARLDVEDAALVLVRVVPHPLSGRMAAELPSVRRVRRMLDRWAHQAGLSPDSAADLELTVSEAVSNVVEHAYQDEPAGEFDYLVRREGNGVVRVEVRDFGRWRPQPVDPGYRGRGLAVIRTLATDVALEGTSSGTRIAFTLPTRAVSLGAPGPAGSGLSDDFRPVSGSDVGGATR
jgi:anti-sigma regulatory factor (Ser/Thr protein kinase)